MSIYDNPTTVALTLRALRRFPQRTAFVSDAGELTYAATLKLIGGLQAGMVAAGLRRGMRVALLSGNRAEGWCAGVAAQGLGLSITWLHPMGSLADHLDQVRDSEADGLIVDMPTYRDRGAELAAQSGVITMTLGPADYGTDLISVTEKAGEVTPQDFSNSEDCAILNYTGGTTGKSKGVLRRHRSSGLMSLGILAEYELPQIPRYLAVAPITHVAGSLVLPSLMRGGTVHLSKGFDPERLLATIARERINMTLLVPTMIYVLLDHPKVDASDLSSLELLLYGASPMSPTRLLEGLERMGPVFSQLYGQTECYPVSVLHKHDHDRLRPERFASCGFPVAGCQTKLLGADGQEVAVGEAGEICLRAPWMMEEYWKRPEQTAEALQGGWLHTGDIARSDEEGYLYIVDRKKDMIVTGGFNVFPREIEDVLTEHDSVSLAAVIGIPDAKWGEAVTALVVRKAGAEVTAEALISLVKERKGGPHAPKQVEFVDALPLTPVGKVDKKALREKYWAGQQRQVG
ncbi:MAG: AMP-binding protein [Bradyrhizobium sp.]|nr:AMP-binding protein [Bradyrhizobium sp.]